MTIHPRWQSFQAGPLPPFVRPRGYRGRPRPHRAFRTTRTVATEIFLADAARNRLRKLARRKAARASRPSAAITHGTERYHALPYGCQPATLFDISVPWDERVIASDALEAEFTGVLPPHLRIKRSSSSPTQFCYTDEGQVVRITDPYQTQSICHDADLDYLCGIALRDNTAPALQDFALARYAARTSAPRSEIYISDWTPPAPGCPSPGVS